MATPLFDLATRLNVVQNFAFSPSNGAGVTWCNCYTSVFCAARGVTLDPVIADDQLNKILSVSPDWTEIGHDEAVTRANAGEMVVAAASSTMLGQRHGHITPLVESPTTDPTGCYVSAAGARNAIRCRLEQSFGTVMPRFFARTNPV